MGSHCQKFYKDVYKEFYKGLVSIPKLIILAITIALLSLTPLGNLIMCKLFDADGCKPRIELSISSEPITNCDHGWLEGKYTSIDKPSNLDLSKFVLVEYLVRINNKGFEYINKMKLRVKTIVTSDNVQARLIGYDITTGPSFKKYIGNNEFDLNSDCFVIEAWYWRLFTKEHAILKVAVAYPVKEYNNTNSEVLIIEGECDSCQTPFKKKLLTKGGTTG